MIFSGKVCVLSVVSGIASCGIIQTSPGRPPKSAASMMTDREGLISTALSTLLSGLSSASIMRMCSLGFPTFFAIKGPTPSSDLRGFPTVKTRVVPDLRGRKSSRKAALPTDFSSSRTSHQESEWSRKCRDRKHARASRGQELSVHHS